MPYNPKTHHRRSIRLKHYDYSLAGLYFITACSQNHACLFGSIKNDHLLLNDAGMMVEQQWKNLVLRFDNVVLHQFVVMPNHFHGIIEITTKEIDPTGKRNTIGEMVGAFKSLSTYAYIQSVKNDNWPSFDKKLWQANFYEHIIRDESCYLQIVEYIETNPLKWRDDSYYIP